MTGLFGRRGEVTTRDFAGNGYNREAEEAGRFHSVGGIESTIVSLDETVEIIETIDNVLALPGVL